jgi:hypothetical protein
MKHSIMTFSIMALRVMTINIYINKKLSIRTLLYPVSYNCYAIMLSANMMSVIVPSVVAPNNSNNNDTKKKNLKSKVERKEGKKLKKEKKQSKTSVRKEGKKKVSCLLKMMTMREDY